MHVIDARAVGAHGERLKKIKCLLESLNAYRTNYGTLLKRHRTVSYLHTPAPNQWGRRIIFPIP